MDEPQILVIHTMKAAGTSLRRALIAQLGEQDVYPNDTHLRADPRGWYPVPGKLLEHVRDGRTGGARLLIGHVPYVLADRLPTRPLTVALLRDPIERAVSMLEHRRSRTKRFRGASYADLLANDRFVRCQIRDYQTKMFAFEHDSEWAEGVNAPLAIDDERFDRAVGRLAEVDVLGVLEDMPRFAQRLQDRTGIALGVQPHDNQGRYDREPLHPAIRDRLEELTVRDALLYRRTIELTGSNPSAPAKGFPWGTVGRAVSWVSGARRR